MRIHIAAVVAALSVATAGWAAEQETGKVVSVNPLTSTLTIETDLGNRIEFHTATSTQMTRDDTVVGLADLLAGTRVRVTADEAVGTAPRHATRIELIPAEPIAMADPSSGIDTSAQAETSEEGLARSDQLPRTASALPLVALLGSAGLLAGLTLRRVNR